MNEEMHMILICPNLKKDDLIALADLQACLLELLINVGSEDHSSILGRAHNVIQQN